MELHAKRKRALVVDDARTIRLILTRFLEEAGYEAVEAENGRDALAWLGTGEPTDLVLVDWDMPEMDGISFLREVRANPAWANVPVVMVTKESRRHNVVEALDAGANEYIMKPFTREVVRRKLELLGLPV